MVAASISKTPPVAAPAVKAATAMGVNVTFLRGCDVWVWLERSAHERQQRLQAKQNPR
jgi:hypothetical protein